MWACWSLLALMDMPGTFGAGGREVLGWDERWCGVNEEAGEGCDDGRCVAWWRLSRVLGKALRQA